WNDRLLSRERCLDLTPDVIVLIEAVAFVGSWAHPEIADQHEQDVALFDRLLDGLQPVLAGPDVVYVLEDLEAAPSTELVAQRHGLTAGIGAPIANEYLEFAARGGRHRRMLGRLGSIE